MVQVGDGTGQVQRPCEGLVRAWAPGGLLRLLAEVQGSHAAVGHMLRHDGPGVGADVGAEEADDVGVPQLCHGSDLGLEALRLVIFAVCVCVFRD